MYTGTADWDMIARVKANPRLHIPVIGNGDITCGAEALRAFADSGVDAVMVGRASIGAPWVFRQIKNVLQSGNPEADDGLTLHDKFAILRRQIRESIERIDDYRGILHIRRHLAVCPLFKGIPSFRPTRVAMLRADTPEQLASILDQVEAMLVAMDGDTFKDN